MKLVTSLMLGVAASIALSAGAFAAENNNSAYAPYPGAFGFDGFYAGVLLGGFFDGTTSYLVAPDTNAISLGAAVGVNFYLTESVLGGFEVQGSADWGKAGVAFDALALGRVGFAPASDFMFYGAAGGGFAGGKSVYAFGGGVEVAAMDQLGVRAEVLGIGKWGSRADAIKADVGLVWHMQ
ncbi:hypothetical protein MNBD_ALPHA12-1380 [hydrothermal vent metagenome]|uniref:Outer membrane protein beta-barrel domain-containing protein n=1 Tax=hydrothermal vent metagenome TaxID=652676 RepID=A0A3B0U0X6_9ZZZZ